MTLTRDEKKDDTHKRYDERPDNAKQIWKKYDEEIAPRIIKNALSKQLFALAELYQVLALARLACEHEIRSDGFAKLDTMASTHFGAFQEGGTTETRIDEAWGEIVKDLVLQRASFDTVAFSGLSTLYMMREGRLQHSTGPVFERLDIFFQQLIRTDNLFEFIQLAARIMYDLSNFPPITRGSAAVNSWIIDNIANIKFGLSASIRPQLYDWTAFFETQEQYVGFYVIATVAKFLEQIPSVYADNKYFFDSLPTILRANPNGLDNIQKRSDSWNQLKSIIKAVIEHSEGLTTNQIIQLVDIRLGVLKFRKPTIEIIKLVNDFKIYKPEELNFVVVEEIIKASNYSFDKFRQILALHNTITQFYLETSGDPFREEALNADWVELEIVRMLSFDQLSKLIILLQIPAVNFVFVNHAEDRLKAIYLHSYDNINIFRKASFATWNQIEKLPPEVLFLFSPPHISDTPEIKDAKKNLQEAIWSGGVRMQDLMDLSLEEIKFITNKSVIENLYLSYQFIRWRDVLKVEYLDKLLAWELKFKVELAWANLNLQKSCKSKATLYFASFDTAIKNKLKTDRTAFLEMLDRYVKLLATTEQKIEAYDLFRKSAIVSAHREKGVLSLGSTEAQIKIEGEIKKLRNGEVSLKVRKS